MTNCLKTHRSKITHVGVLSTVILLSACGNGNNTVQINKPAPRVPDGSALTQVSSQCQQSTLCRTAVQAANALSASPESTCYRRESRESTQAQPFVNLTDSSTAHVSSAGFVSYALNNKDAPVTDAYSEIKAFASDSNNWPQAHEYQAFFEGVAQDTVRSAHWQASTDLNQLRVGDVLSWCKGKWCEGAQPDHESGYAGIVVGVDAVSASQVKAATSAFPADTQFWKVAVVDSSWRVHGSNHDQESAVIDKRHYGGNLHDARCQFNGGVGAGVVTLAQWQEAEMTRWAYLYFDTPDHKFSTHLSTLRVAFASPM
ncbi:hypothetical protein L1285_04060 [Pseudoalteromonas sp. DL2-H2.2]|uniref:hypothetical protein n=1 Tax=Pseudoalteromonas sp. DL2-H2.2 TaxID=2908889 RepID=UPI001F229E26|nr:hypothetical protein [Pseudoalteromonas sp. DL2-H2.2]MCF2907491.1 hypothetical protein [Pseudoalteromonas sp. DL2-H2.2]